MSIIEVKNLEFRYSSKKPILKNLNMIVEKGEYVALLGHNGSGKSTLAKLLVGLLEPRHGEIKINDIILNENTCDEIRQNIGIVFQNPDNQFFGITVKDDIAFGLENRCFPVDEMERLVLKYARLVGMEDFLGRNPEELSGGQKQRVAIAGVLAFDPEIIIFDEATSMLDPHGVKEVMNTIKSLVGNKTIISITHNLNEAIYCDRAIVLDKGEIVLNDKPIEVFSHPDILKNCHLDITDSMKLIELLKKEDQNEKIKKVEEILWELTFQK